jgi:hypothetical protein
MPPRNYALLLLALPLAALATQDTAPQGKAAQDSLSCKAYRQSLDLLRKLDVPAGTANVVSGRTGKVRTGDVWAQVWIRTEAPKDTETVSTSGRVRGLC